MSASDITWSVLAGSDPTRLVAPLRLRKPRRITINGDLFAPDIAPDITCEVFAVMAHASMHTFIVSTEHPDRARLLLSNVDFVKEVQEVAWTFLGHGPRDVTLPAPNIWLGVDVSNQWDADIRVPELLGTPAAHRWLNAQPLAGSIILTRLPFPAWSTSGTEMVIDAVRRRYGVPWLWHSKSNVGLDWVVTGGGNKPMHPAWVRSLRDVCLNAGVPFTFTAWGKWVPDGHVGEGGEWHWATLTDAKDPKRVRIHPAGMTAMHPGNTFDPIQHGHPNWEAVMRHGSSNTLDGEKWEWKP